MSWATKITGEIFTLSLSSDLTLADNPDTSGAGMAIIVDAILGRRIYMPDGFEQHDGYRVYRYKRMK